MFNYDIDAGHQPFVNYVRRETVGFQIFVG